MKPSSRRAGPSSGRLTTGRRTARLTLEQCRGQSASTASKPARGGTSPRPAATASETLADRRKRARKIVAGLRKLYPQADCELKHHSAYELLVATILSAQSTDETVNKVMPVLVAKYSTPGVLAEANPAEVESMVKTTGFFRQKTRSIIGACKKIMADSGGQVPASMAELTQLPGVARKTANVVLGTWFGRNEGVVVDTHVGRLAHRLGLTWSSKNEKDAVKIEQDLMQVLPREEWTYVGHTLIWHGRRVCSARKPDCAACTLNMLCPSAFTFEPSSGGAGSAKRAGTAPRGRSV